MNARVKELFSEVADLSPQARTQYFAEHEVDEDIRREVRALLAFDSDPNSFLLHDIGVAASRAVLDLELESKGTRCGPYRLLELVGRGGMGAVYLAERADGEVTQQLAVKLLPPGAGDAFRERFLQERQILAALAHPNIARMLDAGHLDNGQPFLAMEYVDGKPIDVFAAGLGVRPKAALFLKVCAAVGYLHRNLVVHRDLKPSNILVTADGEPKLLDFGIAKILDVATDSTLTSMRMLTPDYASPEQVRGGRVSTATDIYSLGAVLYRLLTGNFAHEFEEHSAEAIAQVVTTREVTRPSKWAPELKGDLEFVLLKALRKDPQERYATVEQFAEDLEAFLESRPVRARSGNAWYRTRKFLRRYWVPVAATLFVITCLSVGLYIANRERERALAAEVQARVERDRAAQAEGAAGKQRDRALSAEEAATSERNKAVAAGTQAIQQRNRAVAEKGRADAEAATAKAISDFLQGDVLAQASANTQARPDTKPDPDLKVRTALDRAAARIPGKFEKQPLVEAAVRQTIATTYRDLGLYPQAQPQLERALQLRSRVQGEQHPDTLSAMSDLADLYFNQGRFAAAQTLHSKVLEVRRRVLGEQHTATLSSLNKLAIVYQRQGQLAQAEAIQSKVLEISRRVLGEEHFDTLSAMISLAVVHVSQRQYAQAEVLDAKAVEIMSRVLGEEHPETLTGMNNLAQVYYLQNKYAQAETLQSKTLGIRRRVLSEQHPDTLESMNNLAVIYRAQGKDQQAEAIQSTTLEIKRRVLGEEHPDTLISMNNLAVTYEAQAKYLEAEETLARTLEIKRRVIGEENPSTFNTMYNLARVYSEQRKYAQAETLYTKLLEILRRTLGPQHPNTAETMASLSELQLHQGKFGDAEPLLREALNAFKETRPDHWKQYYLQSLLGAALTGQKRYAVAEPLLLSGYAGLIQRKDAIPLPNMSGLADAGKWIVQLYQAWDQPDRAAEWRAKLKSDGADAIGVVRK
jgi:serine/threonine protein kinase